MLWVQWGRARRVEHTASMAFRAGDRIKAKYLASSAGIKAPGGWFAGKIVKANADGTFNLRYDDGDSENAVLARYIKLDQSVSEARPTKRPAPEEPSRPVSNRVGKRRAVAQHPELEVPEPAASQPTSSEPIIVDDDHCEAVETEPHNDEDGDNDDDGVAIVDAPAAQDAAAAAAASGIDSGGAGACEDDEEDIQFVGRTGDLALVDFPHSREWCTTKPFVAGKEAERCHNCWCYVCDAAAAECPEWSTHCHATHSSTYWQQQRARWKAHGGKPPAAGAAASSSAGVAEGASSDEDEAGSGGLAAWRHVPRWSCDEILAAVQQVYPAEEPEPAGFPPGTLLRPCACPLVDRSFTSGRRLGCPRPSCL